MTFLVLCEIKVRPNGEAEFRRFKVADLTSVSLFGELNHYLRNWIAGREGITLHKAL